MAEEAAALPGKGIRRGKAYLADQIPYSDPVRSTNHHLWIWPVHCAVLRPRTVNNETRIGHADENWPDWYARFMSAEQEGTELLG
jgi:hypothetical protein